MILLYIKWLNANVFSTKSPISSVTSSIKIEVLAVFILLSPMPADSVNFISSGRFPTQLVRLSRVPADAKSSECSNQYDQ